jgi:hypothetical protein
MHVTTPTANRRSEAIAADLARRRSVEAAGRLRGVLPARLPGTAHRDSVETFIDYRVPPTNVSDLARFDGSVIVERTAGGVSARCHDEQANLLALSLMHDIVTGTKNVDEARAYYGKEFADHRRKKPTPYTDTLRFQPGGDIRDPRPAHPVRRGPREGRSRRRAAGIGPTASAGRYVLGTHGDRAPGPAAFQSVRAAGWRTGAPAPTTPAGRATGRCAHRRPRCTRRPARVR